MVDELEKDVVRIDIKLRERSTEETDTDIFDRRFAL